MIRKEKIRFSRTRTASTLFYTKRSRVSWIRAITDTDTGEEKRTGEVPTLYFFVNGHGQMLLFISKMGVHWYFWFAVKTADNGVKLLKYKALKQM